MTKKKDESAQPDEMPLTVWESTPDIPSPTLYPSTPVKHKESTNPGALPTQSNAQSSMKAEPLDFSWGETPSTEDASATVTNPYEQTADESKYDFHRRTVDGLFSRYLSPDERAKRERSAAAVQSVRHLGNVFANIANLGATMAGAPSQTLDKVDYTPLKEWMTKKDAEEDARDERKYKASALDHAEYLDALKRQQAAALEREKLDRADVLAKYKAKLESDAKEAERKFKAGEAQKQREHEAEQNRLKRENDVKIAKTNKSARIAAAKVTKQERPYTYSDKDPSTGRGHTYKSPRALTAAEQYQQGFITAKQANELERRTLPPNRRHNFPEK